MFSIKYESLLSEVNHCLENMVAEADGPESVIYEAMKYSLSAGGKRLRPVLSLAVAELLGVEKETAMPYAAAIEMIHTYSLIHDDLPSMDDDDYRRGKPSNHKVFGESVAILAGDALLNKAYEIILEDMASEENNDLLRSKTGAARVISRASGTSGMVGGQVVDLKSEGEPIGEETLIYMHRRKTGALIKASVIAPAMLANAGKDELNALEGYVESIGIAFQIKDDIMDVEGTFEEMGKASGSDAGKNKSTYVTLFGMEESRRRLKASIDRAVKSLEMFGGNANFLIELARYIERRKN